MTRSRSLCRKLCGFVGVGLLLCSPCLSFAATGCDLNNPDRDVFRLFPGATRYVAKYRSLTPDELAATVAQLDERLRGIYEPLSVPYTFYEIYRQDERIGYIHGVNQKGQFGGLQVFVALDLSGTVRSFYIQKMVGRSAGKFRDGQFGKAFIGISLKDFQKYDPVAGKGSGPLAAIQNPAPDMETDFYGVLRALKKNLILMDVFVYWATRKHP
jgi:hypothetical protein